ncbi:acyl-CoA thioesterase II [Helicocarpus griseus UAMH5409]|uniref:Acyl-CoA thioesterase II n=1 Tax=Helicocarpus griseus UAMH5409 TaxID=1447875 RepID=A0A2B7Y7Z9_9EURO|nr:acyl-CoA thioesterase II [Helicocarpus griseus UAMH5409]
MSSPPTNSPARAAADRRDEEEEPPAAPEAPPAYPFVKLMALERLDGYGDASGNDYDIYGDGNGNGDRFKFERFRALIAPYRPDGFKAAYGGHVFAQSAYAASKTVGKGFVLHNITGSFTLPGMDGIPYTYTVRHVREGSTYCLRAVDVSQGEGVCFSCLCSFKRAERGYNYEHQQPANIQQRYKVALDGKKIEDHPLAPAVDRPSWNEEIEKGLTEELHCAGVEARKVVMDKYNESVDARNHKDRYRQLQFYRLLGLPGLEDEADAGTLEEIRKADEAGEYDNLYVCAHLFQSDRSSLFVIAWAHDMVYDLTNIASLSHTVIIHTHGPALRMIDWSVPDEAFRRKWFTLEAHTSRSGENRGLFQGQAWGPDGTLVATMIQDGLLRVSFPKL